MREPLTIAVMPDVHFHDIYATFDNPKANAVARLDDTYVLRSMAAQLKSTRLFNENYFAFIAALDDAIAKGARIILLPGDFSDDGQALHMQGLQKIISDYANRTGVRFFATVGNHDPVKPYKSVGGEPDFLTQDGREQFIASAHADCEKPAQSKIICSDKVAHAGYTELLGYLSNAGFFPDPRDIHWESPYKSNDLAKRGFDICAQGAASLNNPNFTDCKWVPDASYLVEPIPGLWLLAIDASIYIPTLGSGTDLQGFNGSGNAGYNAMHAYKPHVLEWIKDISQRAVIQGKTLVSFSHFPAGDFYQDKGEQIAKIFAPANLQLGRAPTAATTRAVQQAGIGIHLAGHMHYTAADFLAGAAKNSKLQSHAQDFLNLQIPSLAAYRAGYTLLTVQDTNIDIALMPIDEVANFNQLFNYYAREHQALLNDGKPAWDKSILQAKNYRDYTHAHLQGLVRGRFIDSDWPAPLRQLLREGSLQDLATAAHLVDTTLLQATHFMLSQDWKLATQRARITTNAITLADQRLDIRTQQPSLSHIPALELAFDFYRLIHAGVLGREDVDPARIAAYTQLHHATANARSDQGKFIHQVTGLVVELYQSSSSYPTRYLLIK